MPIVYRFADIEVHERELHICRNGDVLPVDPKAFRVLLHLFRNPGRLVVRPSGNTKLRVPHPVEQFATEPAEGVGKHEPTPSAARSNRSICSRRINNIQVRREV